MEFWEEIKRDAFQGPLYKQLEDSFEYNIVVLGAPRVGKSSLVSSITARPMLAMTTDTQQMYEAIGLRQAFKQEITKHNLQLADG